MREITLVADAILDLYQHTVETAPKLLPKDIKPYKLNRLNASEPTGKELKKILTMHQRYF